MNFVFKEKAVSRDKVRRTGRMLKNLPSRNLFRSSCLQYSMRSSIAVKYCWLKKFIYDSMPSHFTTRKRSLRERGERERNMFCFWQLDYQHNT